VPKTNGAFARRSLLAKTGGADGEVVWSRYPDADINLVTMLRITLGTVARKPGSPRRSRKKPLKPLRRECRRDRRTCGDLLACFLFLHARLRVRLTRRHSLRPLEFRGRKFSQKLGQMMRREGEGVRSLARHSGARVKRASPESRDSGSGPSDHPGMTTRAVERPAMTVSKRCSHALNPPRHPQTRPPCAISRSRPQSVCRIRPGSSALECRRRSPAARSSWGPSALRRSPC